MKPKTIHPKITFRKQQIMTRKITGIIKEKGTRSDFYTMQRILFPLMVVKTELDLRQEHKESVIHNALDEAKVKNKSSCVIALTDKENQEILSQNEALLIQSINDKKRELYVTSGRVWIQLKEEIDGLNGILDVTSIASKVGSNIKPTPIISKG